MKTFSAKASQIERKWHVVDADSQVVGRVAAKVASILRGKHKPMFTPHVDCGDFVIVVNAQKAVFTGSKEEQKVYLSHSGYPGGQKSRSVERLRATFPERIIEHAVRGMIPHTRLGRAQFRKLKVYRGPNHPHDAQTPTALAVN